MPPGCLVELISGCLEMLCGSARSIRELPGSSSVDVRRCLHIQHQCSSIRELPGVLTARVSLARACGMLLLGEQEATLSGRLQAWQGVSLDLPRTRHNNTL
eukprot:5385807-Alexandrium_andersonii.AAC.1